MPTTKQYEVTKATLDDLVVLIQRKRQADGLSLRQAAEQIGIPHSTLNHIELGVSPRLVNVQAIIDWLAS